jgi:hypothetical protein
MKIIFIILALLIAGNLYSKPLPTIPADCFENGYYCSDSGIVKKEVNGRERKVIFAAIYARLDRDFMDEIGFESVEDIEMRFMDFNNWENFVTDYEGNDNQHVKEYKACMKIDSRVGSNGESFPRHYADYVTRAPGIIGGKIKIREVTEYTYTNDFEDANNSLYYRTVLDETFNIEGERVLIGAEGIKYKTGFVNIRHDENEDMFYIYYTMYTVPAIDFALGTAKPYVKRPVIDILVAMFNLPFNSEDYYR